jgi:hypothetical protein
MKETSAQFHEAMREVYRRAKRECNYSATRFLEMVSDKGGVATAKHLLCASDIQYGFAELWERRRLDLTVEAHVLKPEFESLFTPEERQEAYRRLAAHGYFK